MANKSILIGLMLIGFLAGCGPPSVASPVPLISPTVAKPPTGTATLALIRSVSSETPIRDDIFMTPTMFPFPPETAVPLSKTDKLYLQLTQKGYKLTSSGSLIGPQGFTYSAHLFINPNLSPRYNSGEAATKDAILVAFYRRDAEKDVLLGLQYLAALEHEYGAEYAVNAGVFNWNWQAEMLGMDISFGADEETRPILKQNNYSSDINQNGLPEFTVVMQYCVCSVPDGRIQLFEIQNTATVKNITQDLPGNTSFSMHTKKPYTFYVQDSYVMEYNISITTH